jgi:hypothetical protein
MSGGERPSAGDDRFRRFMEGLREIDRLEKAPYREIEAVRRSTCQNFQCGWKATR